MRIVDTLLTPNGRISRARLWFAGLALAIVAGTLISIARFGAERFGFGDDAPWLIELLLAVPLAWIGFCLLAKRWHDRGRSGAWVLLLLLPVIGLLWTLIECGFVAGTRGGNKYGAPTSPDRHAAVLGDDIPEDMADPSGTVYLTPENA